MDAGRPRGDGVPASGVLMNGNGYCLQAGPPLAIGFDGQCDGQAGQLWAYRAATGLLQPDRGRADWPARPAPEPRNCAVLGGPLVPGTPVVSRGLRRGDAVEPGLRGDPGPARGLGPAAGDTGAGGGPAGGGRPLVSTAGGGAGAAAGGGLLLAALLAGLLLMTGATLVFFGRRSRAARRDRPAARPALGRAADTPDDDGPYVVDVTDEVARRQRAQEVVDSRPTAAVRRVGAALSWAC